MSAPERKPGVPVGKAVAALILTAGAIGAWSWALRQPPFPWAKSVPSVTQAEATPVPTAAPAPTAPPDPFTWAAAVNRVEEPRGSAGRLAVPAELMHYGDRRRFLAVQMADSEGQEFELPHDQAELAQMVARGELVELGALGEDHLLYDVGTALREDPLTHYDVASGKDVPLFGSMDEYLAEDQRLAALAQGKGREAVQARERLEWLAGFYGDPVRRDQLFAEHEAVTALARNFNGLTYDLTNPADRTRFQVRLLSFARPEAREVMMEIARAYRERFGRLLPVTSLVRTQRYQRRMSRLNPNATVVDIAPHTTGMAFDISYKYMAVDEQNFVMDVVAALERAGAVEALRERRNHLHVYTLAEGRPAETLIASFLDDVEAAHPGSAPQASPRKKAPAPKVRKASRRTGAAKPARKPVKRTRSSRRAR
jgi:hypothetical protein